MKLGIGKPAVDHNREAKFLKRDMSIDSNFKSIAETYPNNEGSPKMKT